MSPSAPPAPLCSIRAPGGLFVAARFERSAEPVLQVLYLDDADGAERARGDHLAGMTHHRIAGVVVGQHEDAASKR